MTVTQKQFGSVKEDIRALSDKILEVQETVNDHTYQLSMIRARLVGIEIQADKVKTRLEKVDGRLDKMDGRLDKMDGRLDGLQDSVSEILTLVRKSQ